VTAAALKLQRAGLIRYARGRITVLDRPGLEDLACECYRAIRAEYDRLLPEPALARPLHAGAMRLQPLLGRFPENVIG
jgi:hypothetical protein